MGIDIQSMEPISESDPLDMTYQKLVWFENEQEKALNKAEL